MTVSCPPPAGRSATVVLLGYGLLCGAVQTLLGGLVADVTADRQKAEVRTGRDL